MNWSYVKMALAGLLVALVVNLLIPSSEDSRISRPAIAFMGLVGSVGGHYVGWKAFGVTRGVETIVASAAGALVLILVYLMITPREP